ncbi:MAG TPA: hypothetical protein VG796_29740 [Verrucomicrobiales bacterium]|nr:hypothetical protein [Verrucomicrobiales bacterium]
MKPNAILHAAPLLLTLMMPPVRAAEVVVLDWNHSWDYMQPMGRDPKLDDPDFNTTWFQKGGDFTANYNGPLFGGAKTPGNPADPASYDHGTGPGPLGYTPGAMEYFTGGEVTAFGTDLTLPNTGNRYTVYFRTVFTTNQTFTSPKIRGLIDDSALIYLDGVLVARVNKADNTEEYTSLAADGTATKNETGTAGNNEARIQAIDLSLAGNAANADAVVVSPVSSLAAGEHTLAVSVQNAGNTSSDSGFGLQLRASDEGISAVASNVKRQDNGPGFTDDTFTFDVTVSATNLPGAASWNSNNAPENGPIMGTYDSVVTYTYPAQVDASRLTTARINFFDATNPALASSVAVTAPISPGTPLVLSAATPSFAAEIEEAGMGLSSFTRQSFNTDLGFTSNGVVVQDMLTNGMGSQMVQFTAPNALLTTEAVRVDPAVKGIKASATVRAYTASTTGFEPDDIFRVVVEGSPNGIAWTELGSVMPALAGNDATTPNPAGIDQIIVKLGPGAPGTPAPKSRLGWATAGFATGPMNASLTVPSFTVPDNQPVQLEFTHRYSFEFDTDGVRWDGGVVQIAVDGGGFTPVPNTAFSAHGYDGVLTGNHAYINLEGFNGDSPGYSTGGMITSVLIIPGLAAGSTCQIQFAGGWDEFSTGTVPNWEINDIKVKSGDSVLYSENFANGDGGLVPDQGWVFDNGTTSQGPAYRQFTRSAIPLGAGDQFVRLKLYQPRSGAATTSEFFLVDHLKLEVGLDPLADADGDGVSNGLEDIAGTNPADAQSAFKIVSEVVPGPAGPGSWRGTLTFPAADFRIWRLQSSADLQTWTDADTRYGDPAFPSLSLFSDANTPKNYWRVSIGY